MAPRLLLDEMFPRAMADQLNAKGHDVRAVVAEPEFVGLPDEDVLIGATEAGRALVTANIKDFMPIGARYRAGNRTHAGLIMVSSMAKAPAPLGGVNRLLVPGPVIVRGVTVAFSGVEQPAKEPAKAVA